MSHPKQAKAENQPKSVEMNAQASQPITAENPIVQKVLYFSLIAIFIAMTVMSFSYGLSGDEVDMNEYGKTILQYFTSFGNDQSVFRTPEELNAAKVYNYNRDGVIQYYGGLFDLICAVVNTVSPLDEYTTRHILNAWAGFLALFFAVKISRRILGDQAALITLWLMFLSPFFLGHSMNNPKDIPFAATYIMAIYFIMQLFDRLPKASKKDYLWAIISIGATINVRVGGILLIPYLVVFVGILFIIKKYFQNQEVSLFSYAKPVIITAVLGYLAGSILWPYALQNPFSNPLTALSEMSNFKVNIRQLFEGSKVFSGDLPINFLPTSFIITNSFVVLAGLALGIVFLWSFRKEKNAPQLYFVLFTALFPLAYIIYSKSNVYHAWRHVLFIFPSIMVVVAFGWQSLIGFFDKMKIKLAGFALLGFLTLEPLYFIASTFPNTITYHNQIVGGPKGAYGKFEMDYYYNSLKQCADWFKKNELVKYKKTDTIVVLSNAAHLLTKYFPQPENVVIDYIRYPERNTKKWDYAIFHIALIPGEDIKNNSWLPSSTLFKAAVQGKTLSAVIKRPSFDDLKGYDYLQKNQVDSALYCFQNYLLKDSSNTGILNMMSNIYMQTNRPAEAERYITKSYAVDSSNMETKQMQGMMRLQKGDFAGAQILFTQILNENPQYAKGYFYLAIAQMNLGNLNQAMNNFNTASQDESIRANCYKYMGDIYAKNGDMQQANKFYQMAGVPMTN
nr:tetratricopeptide repeat protein [Chitinophagaceae bacterium]